MQTISIASGRGGVGKSVVVANLALAMVHRNKKVIVLDLDLGSPCLHLLLGRENADQGLSHFICQPKIHLRDLLQPTTQPNLSIIAGASELYNAAEIDASTSARLQQQLSELDCDYLLLDLSAGVRADTLDFFIAADQQILVTTPTITASTGAYLFLKNLVFRLLATRLSPSSQAAQHLLQLQQHGVPLQKIHLLKLEQHLTQLDSEFAQQLDKARLRPQLVLNMMHHPQELSRAYKLCRTSRDYLGIELDYLGLLYYDDYQKMALEAKKPLLNFQPGTVLSQGIYRIASRIIRGRRLTSDLRESFQTAENEAKADLALKNLMLEELISTEKLDPSELAETIKSQRHALDSLQLENRRLKQEALE